MPAPTPDAPIAVNTTKISINSWEGVITEITTLRDRLTRPEAKINPSPLGACSSEYALNPSANSTVQERCPTVINQDTVSNTSSERPTIQLWDSSSTKKQSPPMRATDEYLAITSGPFVACDNPKGLPWEPLFSTAHGIQLPPVALLLLDHVIITC
ncbi:hypothetical protein BGZ61DRAFT_542272 [Ilyonectria robusta]|uniref:uncharacterized protein n=1 Tax=Ilyonectria robusta TaxID=1079257 RepID=UPI001E8CE7F7|nr:uncharacterized protein BGZ61DRAFT_542272 [Ilyonectria robusta]KAH8649596.1 hypothetical protein BGZ61DRAFT_542272 [Ilyonectria robusta]